MKGGPPRPLVKYFDWFPTRKAGAATPPSTLLNQCVFLSRRRRRFFALGLSPTFFLAAGVAAVFRENETPTCSFGRRELQGGNGRTPKPSAASASFWKRSGNGRSHPPIKSARSDAPRAPGDGRPRAPRAADTLIKPVTGRHLAAAADAAPRALRG